MLFKFETISHLIIPYNDINRYNDTDGDEEG